MTSPVTVSELTRQIKSVIEDEFQFVFVIGEISNFKKHSPSGHFYFVVKDSHAQISALMWSSRNRNLLFTPEDGMKVIIKGRVTLYETRGSYQIDVFDIEPYGVGDLQLTFEELKEKLYDEGLFDEEYKKPIPSFPQRVGIITSETGAVIKDFCRVTSKRYPLAEIFLFPVNVQGANSAKTIVNGIICANKFVPALDVIVIARGGGSLEDLWSFNEEDVARAIFASEIPVVSAVGHEVDYTISDFVSDLRAPTPSAAAEMIFPDKKELLERINQFEYYINVSIRDKISNLRDRLDRLGGSYFLNRPFDILNEYKVRVDDHDKLLNKLVSEKFYSLNNSLNYMEKILKSIDPDTVLKRGYTMIKKDEELITSSKALISEEEVDIIFSDGEKPVKIK